MSVGKADMSQLDRTVEEAGTFERMPEEGETKNAQHQNELMKKERSPRKNQIVRSYVTGWD